MHTMAKNDFHDQSIVPSINYPITRTLLPIVDKSAMLKLVSEVCETLTSAWISVEGHCMVGLYM